MKTLIRNVAIIDANNNKKGNILIENDIIKKISSEDIKDENAYIIDGSGLTLLPSFIDMHTHLREPGLTYKEDLESGQKAALKGGFTHLVPMGNTKPVCDNPETINYIIDKSNELDLCELYQVCTVTKNLKGKEIVDFDEMRKYTKVFSDDGITIFNEEIMKEALRKSKELGFLLLTHCQPEYETVERDLKLLENIEGNLHVCHISLKKTIDIIKKYKDDGYKLSCEVTPHHIYSYGLDYRVNPSIANIEDMNSMIQGIKDGYIDAIGTDHAPHSHEDKVKGSPGISNIEVAFSMVYSVFKENDIKLNKLSEMMSYNPAKILGIKDTGLIKENYKANLVLIDLNNDYEINTEEFISKGKNNPYNGDTVSGKVVLTMREGVIKYDNR